MPHGNSATIDVDEERVELEFTDETQGDTREGFVDLEQVNVLELHAGTCEHLARSCSRAGEHDGGLAADRRKANDPCTRLISHSRTHFARADQHSRGTVDDTA